MINITFHGHPQRKQNEWNRILIFLDFIIKRAKSREHFRNSHEVGRTQDNNWDLFSGNKLNELLRIDNELEDIHR